MHASGCARPTFLSRALPPVLFAAHVLLAAAPAHGLTLLPLDLARGDILAASIVVGDTDVSTALLSVDPSSGAAAELGQIGEQLFLADFAQRSDGSAYVVETSAAGPATSALSHADVGGGSVLTTLYLDHEVFSVTRVNASDELYLLGNDIDTSVLYLDVVTPDPLAETILFELPVRDIALGPADDLFYLTSSEVGIVNTAWTDSDPVDEKLSPLYDLTGLGPAAFSRLAVGPAGEVVISGGDQLFRVDGGGPGTGLLANLGSSAVRDLEFDLGGNVLVALQTEILRVDVSSGAVATVASGLDIPDDGGIAVVVPEPSSLMLGVLGLLGTCALAPARLREGVA